MSVGRKLIARAANWGCAEGEKLAMLLLVQRMRELLLHTTSIAAKPLFTSALSIAREIYALLSQHTQTPHSSTEANLKQLMAEFNDVLAVDRIARNALGDRLRYISTSILNFSDNRTQMEAIQFLIGRFAIGPYTQACAENIISIVEDGGRKKRELLTLAESYIAAIKEAGYPNQTIYHLLNVSFLDNERNVMSARERLEQFFANFDFEDHSYSVYFGLKDVATKVTDTFSSIGSKYWRIESTEYIDFVAGLNAGNRRFFCEHGHEAVVKFEDIRALDPQSARVEAERRLRLLDDLLRFSVHRRRFVALNQALVQKDNTTVYINSNRPKPPVLLVPHDTETGQEGLKGIASALRRTRGSSTDRFVRAIELHGTALSALEDESQLLNMWIALETLFVSGRNGSKIKEIIDSVIPYVTASWNQYVFGELWERIEQQHSAAWNAAMQSSSELTEKIGYLQFVMAVSIRRFEPQMTDFLSRLDDDPLLRYKVFECIEWAQQAKSIRERVELIQAKVVSDINRIYRTRNRIVHIGGSGTNMSDIVQISHYYLDLVLALLSFLLGSEHGCMSIEQANMETKIKMENYLSSLNDFSANGALCESGNFDQLLFGRPMLA